MNKQTVKILRLALSDLEAVDKALWPYLPNTSPITAEVSDILDKVNEATQELEDLIEMVGSEVEDDVR